MEALAALGLAANVAQFIGMAGKTVAKTRELAVSHKGLTEENEELQLIVSDFKKVVSMLQSEIGAQDIASAELQHLIEVASEVCAEIDSNLESIKARRAKKKRLGPLMATWKELNMKDVFRDLERRLSGLRDQISVHINIVLIRQQASLKSALVDTVGSSQGYVPKLNQEIAEFKSHTVNSREQYDEEVWRVKWLGNSEQLYDLGRSLELLMPHFESFQKNEKILESLYFSQVEERRDNILDAHMSTYSWVFEANAANFRPWLESPDASIYWIAGKAGSGKSTLMKYIHKHERMQAGLERWARKRPILIASHFFWGTGTLMQQSHEGLLRTLVFQLLQQCPDLSSLAFPDRWKASLQPAEVLTQKRWALKELLGGLTNLLTGAHDRCVLIFVDGLDEYNGNLDDLIEIVEALAKIPNVKICVSSRPWLDFSDAFSESPWKLYLHDLTRKDIEHFTLSTLEKNNRFKSFKTRNQKASLELVSCITDRAQGVFLWVRLAVQSLLQGIKNADNIVDLQRRLDELPRQLEPFFERMLNSIDDFYKSRTAKVLLVLTHARMSLPLVTFYFLDSQDGLPFDPRRFLHDWPSVDAREEEEVEAKKRQLIAQFKDLINIYEHPLKAPLFNFSVGFIHRSVIDFIRQVHIQQWLYQRAGSTFSPLRALFEVSLDQFKIFSHFWRLPFLHSYLRHWFLSAVYHGREIEVVKGQSVSYQLNQLQDVLSGDTDKRPFRRKPEFHASWWHGSMKDLAVGLGLCLYAEDMAGPSDVEAALEPQLCIELQTEFVIKMVTDIEREKRCVIDVEWPSYTSTLHMFTAAEEKSLSNIRAKRNNPEPPARLSGSRLYDEPVVRVPGDAVLGSTMSGALSRSDVIEMPKPKVSMFKKFRKLRILLK